MMKDWHVYLVMDLQGYGDYSAYELAEYAINGGVNVIQIREKHMNDDEFMERAKPIRALCKQREVCFIVNDRVHLTVALDADGLHVGQDDMPGKEARSHIGNRLLGISASSMEEARRAIKEGADYLGVGSIYPTVSKADAGEAVTPSLIEDIRTFSKLPIVGIGGIAHGNAAAVIEAGANAVAVISAICHAESPEQAAVSLIEVVKSSKK
jgi:thiamine-phosphate pyrophosphorylase